MARNRASSSPGKATIRFSPATTSRPARLPSTTGMAPMTRPHTAPMPTTSRARTRDNRVATSVRARTSRPRASVPNGCAADGPDLSRPPAISAARSLSSGRARTAVTRRSTSSEIVTTPSGDDRWCRVRRDHDTSALLDRRTRVDKRDGDVDREVDQEDAGAEEERYRLDDRVVLREHRLYELGADAGPGEHVLDEHRPGQHRR